MTRKSSTSKAARQNQKNQPQSKLAERVSTDVKQFQREQARRALQNPLYVALPKESLARYVAQQVIKAFPNVVLEKAGDGQRIASRTQLAMREADKRLTASQRQNTAEVTQGKNVARHALDTEFEKLKHERRSTKTRYAGSSNKNRGGHSPRPVR